MNLKLNDQSRIGHFWEEMTLREIPPIWREGKRRHRSGAEKIPARAVLMYPRADDCRSLKVETSKAAFGFCGLSVVVEQFGPRREREKNIIYV